MRIKMYDLVREQKQNPSLLINSKVRSEEVKMTDILFSKTGIEVRDVEPSIERLQLETDPEYKAIVDEWTDKYT